MRVPPRPDGSEQLPRDGRGLDPAAPDDAAGQDLAAVAEDDSILGHLVHAEAEHQLHTVVLELAGRVLVRLVRKGAQHDLTVIDEVDARAIDLEGVVSLRHHLVHEVGERSRGLDSGRACADDHEVQRALVDELRLVRRFLEQLEDSGAQLLRVGHRIQR